MKVRSFANMQTRSPGLPALWHACFQAHKGWRKGRVRGQTAVAQLSLPKMRSIFLEAKPPPEWRFRRICIISSCFVWPIRTMGPTGLITKPSQVFTSLKLVFFQLRGMPKASSVARRHDARCWSTSERRSQQKSSTKTSPQSTSRKRLYST